MSFNANISNMGIKGNLPVGNRGRQRRILDYINSSQKTDHYSILAKFPTVI